MTYQSLYLYAFSLLRTLASTVPYLFFLSWQACPPLQGAPVTDLERLVQASDLGVF
jgi:hypothetical protein